MHLINIVANCLAKNMIKNFTYILYYLQVNPVQAKETVLSKVLDNKIL